MTYQPTATKTITCDACQGAGQTPSVSRHDHKGRVRYIDSHITCWTCRGSGSIEVPDWRDEAHVRFDLFPVSGPARRVKVENAMAADALAYWLAQPETREVVWSVVTAAGSWSDRRSGPAAVAERMAA